MSVCVCVGGGGGGQRGEMGHRVSLSQFLVCLFIIVIVVIIIVKSDCIDTQERLIRLCPFSQF